MYIGFTPHKKQKEIIQSILNGKEKFHIVSVGRQMGKSLMGMNLALYWGINNGPCKILWVSPVYSQTNKVHKELVAAITESGIIKSNNYGDNTLTLKNGTEILFRSAERYDNIRGLTCDYGIIDEAAFMKNDAWAEAIRPVFAVRGKKVLFISTPKGKNYFYDLFQLGQSGDNPRYKSYTGSSYDTPYIDRDEIEDARTTLPKQIFEQEYLATFIDDGGEVFSNIKANTFAKYPNQNGKIYCGIDLGRADDYTVATFIDKNGTVIDMYRNNKVEWSTMVREIIVLIKKYNATVMVEVNSIGDVIYEQLKAQWQNTIPFVTTAKSKPEIIEGLILDFNESNIKIPNKDLFPPLLHELSIFSYEYNPRTRNVRYGAPSPHHDDCVMSLAIANYNRKQNQSIGTYAVMGKR
ncbi:MAG: terminase family protein [Gammaproteobacteria bacterium]|nr:terminase family protein [Gammaproteobacteria bacterium]